MQEIQAILDKALAALTPISGIEAIVLGGSRARGTHTPDSDIDIGIYYDPSALDLEGLNRAAQALDDARRENLVTPPGGWGNWVNAGGWLIMGGRHVDLILRDIGRVEGVIEDCRSGSVSAHYQPGHPHAYISAMYMGELAACRMLHDRQGKVTKLKRIAETYPPKLKASILGFFGFEADFSLKLAQGNAARNDPYYVTAHIVRAVSALNQVLFALNETYCLNEKKAVAMIDDFPLRPADYKARVTSLFSDAGTDNVRACTRLGELVDDVMSLVLKTEK